MHIRHFVILAALRGAAVPASAQQSAPRAPALADDSVLESLIADALERNPTLLRRRAAHQAAGQRIRPAGALPDPLLRIGWMDPFESWHTFTQLPITLEQEFPWPGTLGARTAFARAVRDAADAEVSVTRRSVVVAVAAAYYRLRYLSKALHALRAQRRLLDAALQVSTTRYATGAAPQSDPLQARLARDRLAAEEWALVGELVATRAALNALRNQPPRDSVSAPPLDAAGVQAAAAPLATTDSLVAGALRTHPRIAARQAEVLRATHAIQVERLAARPDVALMVEYQYQGRVPITNEDLPDFGTVFVGLRLPIWAWRKQHRLADAARADSAGAAAALRETEAQLARDVAETAARAEAARRRLQLLVDGVLPAARATVESVVRSYQVGRTEFVTVIAVEDALFRADVEAAAVAADYQTLLVMLRQLVAEEP